MNTELVSLNFTGPKADYSLLGDIRRPCHYILMGPGTDLDDLDKAPTTAPKKKKKRRYVVTKAQQRARHGLRIVGSL